MHAKEFLITPIATGEDGRCLGAVYGLDLLEDDWEGDGVEGEEVLS